MVGNSIRIQKALRVTHCESGLRLAHICNFGGCPWVRLDPGWMYSGSEVSSQQGTFVMSDGMNAVHEAASLNPLSRAVEAALEAHRMQGHVPYDPRCIICARGKSTFQHRRRREGTLETEVHADFVTSLWNKDSNLIWTLGEMFL